MRVAAIAALVLSAQSACSTTCTLVEVDPGLTLTILAPDDLLPAEYRLDVVADGESVAFVEPRDGEPFLCPGADECVVALAGGLTVELRSRPNGFELYFDRGDSGPSEVEVSISRDGAPVETFAVTPEYVTDEPNGDGCGEVTRASEVVEIDGL